MSDRRLMPVQLEVIKEVLVDKVLGAALERYPGEPGAEVRRALDAELALPPCDGGPLDLRMRRIGYLCRIVEAELFEPARQPMEGLAAMLERRAIGDADGHWWRAAAAVSSELAGAEPLPKPDPDDPAAVSWRVPGPGGHVRHYVVAAAIAESLGAAADVVLDAGADAAGRRRLPDGIEDAGEIKRCWTYGFLVRCCEQARAPASPLSPH